MTSGNCNSAPTWNLLQGHCSLSHMHVKQPERTTVCCTQGPQTPIVGATGMGVVLLLTLQCTKLPRCVGLWVALSQQSLLCSRATRLNFWLPVAQTQV
jgi:hypothetical protein